MWRADLLTRGARWASPTTETQQEYLLNLASQIGQKGPMSADAGAILIPQKHVVSTDGDESGVTDFHLVVKLDETLGLAPLLWAVSSPAEHQHHGIWPL